MPAALLLAPDAVRVEGDLVDVRLVRRLRALVLGPAEADRLQGREDVRAGAVLQPVQHRVLDAVDPEARLALRRVEVELDAVPALRLEAVLVVGGAVFALAGVRVDVEADQAEAGRAVVAAEADHPATLVGVTVAAFEEGPVVEPGRPLDRDALDPQIEAAVKRAVHRREGLGLADEV